MLRGPHDKPHKLNSGWGRLGEELAGLNRLAQTLIFFPSSSYITPNMEKDTCLPPVPEEIELYGSSSGRWEPDGVTFSFFLGIHRMGTLWAGSNMSGHLVIWKWRKIRIQRSQVTCPGVVAELGLNQIFHHPHPCPFYCTLLPSID